MENLTNPAQKTEKPWLQHYPAGVPANIDPSQYACLLDMLKGEFREVSRLPGLHFYGEDVHFRRYGPADACSPALISSRAAWSRAIASRS